MKNRYRIIVLLVANSVASLLLTVVVGIGINITTGADLTGELAPLRRFLWPLALIAAVASTALSTRLFFLERQAASKHTASANLGDVRGDVIAGHDIRTGQGSTVKGVDVSYGIEQNRGHRDAE